MRIHNILFSGFPIMTMIVNKSDGYHRKLLQQLFTTKSEGTATLCSGSQQVTVQIALLRNASKFLEDLLPSTCSCSCNDNCIMLPQTSSPALKCFVELLYIGFLPRLSTSVKIGVLAIAKALGIENVMVSAVDLSENVDDDLDPFYDDDCSNHQLKVSTLINFSDQSLNFHFPKSRINRINSPDGIKQFPPNTFKGRLQKDYNHHPVGQYLGPYDQNEQVSLSAQLPHSDLDYTSYTEFSHDGRKCYEYKTSNYTLYDDLQKIDSYKVKSETDSNEKKAGDDNTNIFYTCQHKLCKIPCPCAHCNSNFTQCSKHKLHHPALFDEKLDAVSIRSSEQFCENESFFSNSYIIKYPGIPTTCEKCMKDLLNHDSYHFEHHSNCRFCSPTFFKTKATNKKELDVLIKNELQYYKSVCPYCDKIFCESFVAKKHIEKEHGEKPFKCEKCDKKFQSAVARSYHVKSVHSKSVELYNCNVCDKQFKSGFHLKEHVRYVHSDKRKWSCDECGIKFKQKRDLKIHEFKKHGISYSREGYDDKIPDSEREYECEQCGATFKYKKNLNAHVKNMHGVKEIFKCDLCESSFKNRKTLTAHKKSKHEAGVSEFPCSICGKIFSEKKNMNRHRKSHVAEEDMED